MMKNLTFPMKRFFYAHLAHPLRLVAIALLLIGGSSWGIPQVGNASEVAWPEPTISVRPSGEGSEPTTVQYELILQIPEGWYVYPPDGVDGPASSSSATTTPSLSVSAIDHHNVASYGIAWPRGEGLYRDEVKADLSIKIEDPGQPHFLSLGVTGGMCGQGCVPVSSVVTIGVPPEIPLYDGRNPTTWLLLVILGLAGGLILNIMPCVWPVLLAKFRSFARMSEASSPGGVTPRQQARYKSAATLVGIIVFFNSLALIAWGVHRTGRFYIWGDHFTDWRFLVVLTLVMLVMGSTYLLPLTLFTGLQRWAGTIARSVQWRGATTRGQQARGNLGRGLLTDFLMGLLAGVLASPCTAPLLTVALAMTLVFPPEHIVMTNFVLFNAIGFGYGAPYVGVVIAPGLARFFPKPGRWLSVAEKAAGLTLLAGALFFGGAAYTTWRHHHLFAPRDGDGPAQAGEASSPSYHFPVVGFDDRALSDSTKAGRTVLVIVTAPWCLTCHYNDVTVWSDERVVKALSGEDVQVMVGVLHQGDEALERYLSTVKSPGLPTYRLYGPKTPKGIGLPTTPTVQEVLQALEKVRL